MIPKLPLHSPRWRDLDRVTVAGTGGLPVLAATTLDGGRTVLVAGSRLGHGLRIWEPETGTVQHIALDVAVTSLATAGPNVIVGHAGGVLGLSLTRR